MHSRKSPSGWLVVSPGLCAIWSKDMVHPLLEDPLVLEQRGGDLHSRKSNMGVFLRGKEKDGLHVMKIRLGSQVCSA